MTSENANAVSHDDIIKLYFSLKEEYRKNAVFLMNDETAMHLRTLKDNNGNYLWRSSDDTILGRPVITSQFMPSHSPSAKAVLFGDLSYYWIFERQPLTLKLHREIYAVQGQLRITAYERLDGRLVKPEAVKVLQMKA